MSKEKLEQLLGQIKIMREQLHEIVEEKESLTSDEIVTASKMLDALLNEYYKLIDKQDK